MLILIKMIFDLQFQTTMFLSQNPQQNYTCLKQSSIGHYLIKHVMAKTSQNNLHFTCKNWVKVLFTIKSVGCFATEKWYSHELLPIYHYGGAGFCIDSYCFEFIIYCHHGGAGFCIDSYYFEFIIYCHDGGVGFCIELYCFEFIIYGLLVKYIHVFPNNDNTIHIYDILLSTIFLGIWPY